MYTCSPRGSAALASLIVITPRRGSVYEQVAAELREQTASGELGPGQRVPSEQELMQIHGVARETARRALALLRAEGLLDVKHGHPTRVKVSPERTTVPLQRGSRIIVRMPTPQERVDLAIGEGVPVLTVQHGARQHIYAGDRRTFTTA